MMPNVTRRQVCALGGLAASLAACSGPVRKDAADGAAHSSSAGGSGAGSNPVSVDDILAAMSLDDKVSQLIVPVVAEAGSDDGHKWADAGVTDLDAVPQLAEALRRHQYGGVTIFGENIQGTEQTCRLTAALQRNNQSVEAGAHVPYLMCADGEGGVVVRLNMGTRMTGAMAVGATGAAAADNARETGAILGGELAAVGVNVDLAPDADVNVNPANPVIGVRSFSDDPDVVATLACAMAEGIAGAGVIPTYKHFPGHGDTGTDSHIGTATVDKSLDELWACELVPFRSAVEAAADLIMTAHITCPQIDEEVTFADGSTGAWPATMSHAILTGILREELGYEGVIITDSLTMNAIATAHLVEGAEGSAEYAANIAERVLAAGADILLNPRDLVSDDAAAFYDEYVSRICRKVESGAIAEERIDQSVRRVLELKETHGILGLYDATDDLESRIAEAQESVGSTEHHDAEMRMAREAITLVSNDGAVPLGPEGSYVLLVRTADEATMADYAVAHLVEGGLLPDGLYVENLISGVQTGSAGAPARVTIDYYYDLGTNEAHYTDDLVAAVIGADAVICETTTWGASALAVGSVQRQTIEQVMADAQAMGAAFVQLSDNLPYDVACYAEANAQVVAYMSTGTGVDPTDRTLGSDAPAYNANFIAALDAVFGGFDPVGTLPVVVPALETGAEGAAVFTGEVLYERGFGL